MKAEVVAIFLDTIALSDVLINDIIALLNAKTVAGTADVDKEAAEFNQEQVVEKCTTVTM